VKKVLTFGILLVVLVGVFTPSVKVFAATCDYNVQILDPVSNSCIDANSSRATTICSTPGGAAPGCLQSREYAQRIECEKNPNSIPCQAAQKQTEETKKNAETEVWGSTLAKWIFKSIGFVLMTLSGLILIFTGFLFDTAIQYTVVDMAKSLNAVDGLGGSINSAWATLRDIANIAFIFVLLYAAFKAMFELNFGNIGKTITNIIIIALLINFSLFFTKVVIDASNIVAMGFYKSISTANNYSFQVQGQAGSEIDTTNKSSSISGGYMRLLGVQGWFADEILKSDLSWQKIFIVGFMSSIFMLVTSVIFLVSGIMFIARFIILIIVMILSAPALVAYIIPGGKGWFDKWVDALKSQAIFAPIFFAMTWVAFKVASAPNFLGDLVSKNTSMVDLVTTAPTTSSFGMVLNYVIVIGFAIAALVISKTMASKAMGFGTITGAIGAGAIGGAAFAGRQTLGKYGNRLANDKDLQTRAAAGDRGARMKLWAAKQGASGSFDARGLADTGVGKTIGAGKYVDVLGKAGGEGGYKAKIDKKTDTRRKPIDDTMRQFRDNPKVLAAYLERQKPEDQQYMYDKLSARDRAAVDESLDTKYGTTKGTNPTTTRLRAKMSPEEKEKTEKALKETIADRQSKETVDLIQELVTTGTTTAMNPATITAATPTGIPYTYDDLLGIRGKLKFTDARKLSDDALRDMDVIKRLSNRHLVDLIANKEMDDALITHITNGIITSPTYPKQASQQAYLLKNKELWNIP